MGAAQSCTGRGQDFLNSVEYGTPIDVELLLLDKVDYVSYR